ncbi:glycoprotein [Dirofilaria immitis]
MSILFTRHNDQHGKIDSIQKGMQIKDDGQPLLYDRLISTKFLPVIDIPNTARVRLVLYNISRRPIIYKLKCGTKASITIESDASGIIPAHGTAYCLLIWRRAPEVNNWKDVKSTSLLMITEFEGSDDPNINEHTVIKIKCHISSSAVCNSAKPPEEYVTFKSSLDSELSQSPSSNSRVIASFTGLQDLSKTSKISSENVMTVNKHTSSINVSRDSGIFYMEIKGMIIIALIIDFVNITNLLMRNILNLRRTKYGLYKYPKVLKITSDRQILNTYIDDNPKFNEAEIPGNEIEDQNTENLLSIACYDNGGTPFPGFLCPLMKIMAHQYGNWRSKIPENSTCEDLMDLNTHPCNHNVSSCVLLALPDSHLIFGCMDDHTGKFVAPQKWVGNNKKYANYLLDFRVDNPLHISQHCKKYKDGRPVCKRNNLFYRKFPILQQLICCCKGDFCADVLFDQYGFNPLPFLHVSVDLKNLKDINQ